MPVRASYTVFLQGKQIKVQCVVGIHAREWMAPAVGLYLIKQLVEHQPYYLRSRLTIHILPIANPDGYEFSRSDVSVESDH